MNAEKCIKPLVKYQSFVIAKLNNNQLYDSPHLMIGQ
jgi:hypothetical protein